MIRKFLFVLTALLHMHSCNALEEDCVAKVVMGVHGGFEYYLRNHLPIVGVSASMEMPMHKRTFFLIKAAINVGQTRSFIFPTVYIGVIQFTTDDFTLSRTFAFTHNIKSFHTNLLFCLRYKAQTKNFEQGCVKSSIGIAIYGDFVFLKGTNHDVSTKGLQYGDFLYEIRNFQSKSLVVGLDKYLCFMDNTASLLLEFHLFLGMSVVGRSTAFFAFYSPPGPGGPAVAVINENTLPFKMAHKMQPLYSYGLKFSVKVSRLANISLFSAFAHAFAKERISLTYGVQVPQRPVYSASHFLNLNQSLLNSQYIIFGVMLSYMNL